MNNNSGPRRGNYVTAHDKYNLKFQGQLICKSKGLVMKEITDMALRELNERLSCPV